MSDTDTDTDPWLACRCGGIVRRSLARAGSGCPFCGHPLSAMTPVDSSQRQQPQAVRRTVVKAPRTTDAR